MVEELSNMVTADVAAAELDLDVSRVRQLLRLGELVGVKIGRDWVIPRQEIERFKEGRKKKRQAK